MFLMMLTTRTIETITSKTMRIIIIRLPSKLSQLLSKLIIESSDNLVMTTVLATVPGFFA